MTAYAGYFTTKTFDQYLAGPREFMGWNFHRIDTPQEKGDLIYCYLSADGQSGGQLVAVLEVAGPTYVAEHGSETDIWNGKFLCQTPTTEFIVFDLLYRMDAIPSFNLPRGKIRALTGGAGRSVNLSQNPTLLRALEEYVLNVSIRQDAVRHLVNAPYGQVIGNVTNVLNES